MSHRRNGRDRLFRSCLHLLNFLVDRVVFPSCICRFEPGARSDRSVSRGLHRVNDGRSVYRIVPSDIHILKPIEKCDITNGFFRHYSFISFLSFLAGQYPTTEFPVSFSSRGLWMWEPVREMYRFFRDS